MNIFFRICAKSIQKQLAYQKAAIAGLFTNLFFGLLRAAVLTALYGSRNIVTGFSLDGAITYTGIAQAIIGFLSLFSWYDLMQSVYTGAVSTDLLKPFNYYRFWMAQDLGRALAQLVLRGLPIMFFYSLIFNVVLPTSWQQWLFFAITLALAWSISFSWRFLLNLSSFWVPNAVGILRFGFLLSWFLSGFVMPLRYFPDWFIQLCYLTPFPHMVNTTVEIFLGVVDGADMIEAVVMQLLWAIGLILLSQLVLKSGIRRLIILGG